MVLFGLGVGLALVGVGLALYGALVEAGRFQVRRTDLSPPRWPAALDGLTILHLSDLHCRRPGRVETFLRALASRLDPVDLVVFTGDYCEGSAAIPTCAAAVSGLRGRLGAFAVLGNNDMHSAAHRQTLVDALSAAGLTVLEDRAVTVEHRGTELAVGGLAWISLKRVARDYRLPVDRVFAGREGLPRILLTHSPDAMPEAVEAGVELVLAGHTHGGQVCLPGGRSLHTNLYRPGPPTYARGHYRQGDTDLFVSAGLGMTRPCLRLWCPPEAVLITLRSAS